MFITDLFSKELKNLLEGDVIPFIKDRDLRFLERWKMDVRRIHPDVATRLRFFSKDNGLHISAEVPGIDRSYGVFDMRTLRGRVFDTDPDLAEAILSPEVLAQVKKIQQSAASPEQKQAQIDAIIAQHSTRHRHATNPITRTPSSSFATKTDEEAVGEGLRDPKDNPCWKGYHPVGTKKKNGRTVPNCVPNANEAANPAQQAAIAIAMKKAEKNPKSEDVAEGSLNEGQYEMMMRNGQVKKFIAKDDADAKRIAAGHGAKSVIRLKGGVPAGKVSEQGVAEGLAEDAARAEAQAAYMQGECMILAVAINQLNPERYPIGYIWEYNMSAGAPDMQLDDDEWDDLSPEEQEEISQDISRHSVVHAYVRDQETGEYIDARGRHKTLPNLWGRLGQTRFEEFPGTARELIDITVHGDWDEVGEQVSFKRGQPAFDSLAGPAGVKRAKEYAVKYLGVEGNKNKASSTNQQGIAEGKKDLELYGLRVGDTVKAVVNGKRVQGDVIDIFPDSMEVELLLRGANAGKTVTVDVRDTEVMNEQGLLEGNKENKAKKNAYVSSIIQKKLDPSVLPSLKYGRQELKKENVKEADQQSSGEQPRIRKYSKIRADGSKAVRYEILDYQGRRVAGQGTEGFDDLENAKSFFKRNYSRLINPIGEEALSKKEKRKEKPVPDHPDRRMLESKKKYWCSTDKRWKDVKEGEQGDQ